MKLTELPYSTFMALGIFFLVFGVFVFSAVAVMLELGLPFGMLFVMICIILSAMLIDYLVEFLP